MQTAPEKQEKRRIPGPAISLGYTMAAGMLVFGGLGYWLDHRKGGQGVAWTIVGLFLGLIYSGYEVWKLVRVANRDDKDSQHTEGQ